MRSLKSLKDVYRQPAAQKFIPRLQLLDDFYAISEENFEKVKNQIINYIETYPNQVNIILSYIALGLHIRAKKRKLITNVIDAILLKYPQLQEICLKLIYKEKKKNLFHTTWNPPKQFNYLKQYFVIKGILPEDSLAKDEKDHFETHEQFYTLYNPNSLEYALMQDDVSALSKQYCYSGTKINLEHSVLENVTEYIEAPPIDFAAAFGSFKCVKYLLAHGHSITEDTSYYSSVGGNLELMQFLEQHPHFYGFIFDYEFPALYHYHDIIDYYYQKKLKGREILSAASALKEENELVFLFSMFSNNSSGFYDDHSPLYTELSRRAPNVDILKLLFDFGHKYNMNHTSTSFSKYKSKKTLLYKAIEHNMVDFNILNLLLEKGGKINELSSIYRNLDSSQATLLYAECQKKQYASLDVVKFLVEKGCPLDKGLFGQSRTITLLFALCSGDIQNNKDIIKYLIEKKAPINTFSFKRKKINKTPLYKLCTQENVDVGLIQFMLDHGANPNIGDKKPLFALCKAEKVNIDAIKLLLQYKADVNGENKLGKDSSNTLFALNVLCSAKTKNLEAITLLFDNGADLSKCSTNPFYEICKDPQCTLEYIKLFVDHGASLHIKPLLDDRYYYYSDDQAYTPLAFVCLRNSIDFNIIQYLIDTGSDVNEGKFKPLSLLCSKEEIDENIFNEIKYLIDKGADVNGESDIKITIEEMNYKFITTPLGIACFTNQNSELIHYLVEKGASVNTPTKFEKDYLSYGFSNRDKSFTPLFSLCYRNELNKDLISFLIDNGADINALSSYSIETYIYDRNPSKQIKMEHNYEHFNYFKNSSIITALCVKPKPDIDFIQYLISKGADLNIGDDPPLTRVVDYKRINIPLLELLLENGANPNKESSKKYPLEYFTNKKLTLNQISAAELLLKHGADPHLGNNLKYSSNDTFKELLKQYSKKSKDNEDNNEQKEKDKQKGKKKKNKEQKKEELKEEMKEQKKEEKEEGEKDEEKEI